MAAWGVTGVIGAGLALIRRAPADRPLAAGASSAARRLRVHGRAGCRRLDHLQRPQPRAARRVRRAGARLRRVHAGGCLVFALAFGPALLRSIQRFARAAGDHLAGARQLGRAAARGRGGAVAGPAVAGGIRAPRRARAAAPHGRSTYLLQAQNADGGFGAAARPALGAAVRRLGGARAGSPRASTCRASPAAPAPDRLHRRARRAPRRGLDRAHDPRRPCRRAVARATSAGTTWWRCLAPSSRGDGSVARPGQPDLVRGPGTARGRSGRAGADRSHGWCAQQDRDGGFSFARRAGPATSTTPAPCSRRWPLRGSRAAAVRARAVAYLRRQQDRDGGFPPSPATAPTRSRPPGRSRGWTPSA